MLEMLHAILIKFPKSVVDNQAQSFFLHLVVALANESDSKMRAMVATVIKVLLSCTSQHAARPILGYSLSWYMGEKQHLWSASAEVCNSIPFLWLHVHGIYLFVSCFRVVITHTACYVHKFIHGIHIWYYRFFW